jgi:hypothetical protein
MAKTTADIRSLARTQTKLAIRTLTGVCGSKAAPAAARVSAAGILLDRGWGRAPQAHAAEAGESQIRFVVRHITEGYPRGAHGGISTTIPQKLPSPPLIK